MAAPNNVDDTGRVIKLPTRSPPFDPPMHVILPRFTHCIGGYLLDQRPSILVDLPTLFLAVSH